jgi:hypothetical protein
VQPSLVHVRFSTKKDRSGSEGALGEVESGAKEKGCLFVIAVCSRIFKHFRD